MEEISNEIVKRPQSKKSTKKTILTIIFVLLNVGIIGYTAIKEFSKPNPGNVSIDFTIVNVLCIIASVSCLVIVLGVETIKYLMMMKALGEKVSIKYAFQTAAFGKYYDSITPTGAGGQPYQIYYLYSVNYSPKAAAAMPLTGFLTMQFGFIVLAIFVFITNGDVLGASVVRYSAYVGILFYLAFPALIVLFTIAPKTTGRIVMFFIHLGAKMKFVKDPLLKSRKTIKSLNDYRNGIITIAREKLLLVKLMVLSVIYQIALCSIPFFVLHIFGGNLQYFDVLCMTVYIYAAVTFIPTPGNAGAAEGSFYLIFESLGTKCLFWAMLIWRFLCYYSFIIIGLLIYAFNAIVKNRKDKVISK